MEQVQWLTYVHFVKRNLMMNSLVETCSSTWRGCELGTVVYKSAEKYCWRIGANLANLHEFSMQTLVEEWFVYSLFNDAFSVTHTI
jgi:hypothetical protein